MAFFDKYPNTDFHELNLDWIIQTITQLHKDWDEFKVVNEITAGGTWDITKQYKAWTIVEDNNNGYISAKPVPAGVPITNTDYWKPTADYSSIIAGLADRVEALETTVGDASSGLVKDVADNTSAIADNTSDIAEINDKIDSLSNKKYIFIGDSYNTAAHHGGWGAGVITKMGLTEGVDVWNSGYPGAGFGNTYYTTQLTDIIDSLSDDEKVSITDVIIAGGVNDWSKSAGEIQTGFTAIETLVDEHLPNAHVTVICCGWDYESASIRNGVLNAYNLYNRLNKKFTIINRAFIPLLNPFFLETDAVHPTEAGMEQLVDVITNILYGGNTFYKMYTDLAATAISVFQPSTPSMTINGSIDESGYTVSSTIGHAIFLDASGSTIPGPSDSWLKIGRIYAANNNLFMLEAIIPCMCMYVLTGNTYKTGFAYLKIEKDSISDWNVYIKSASINPGQSDYPVTNCTRVYPIFNARLGYTDN